MDTTIPMKTTAYNKNARKSIRHIAITGSTPKSCRKIKLLLKRTSYHCLIDYYKNSNELAASEAFYLPDCAILEVRSVLSLWFLKQKIQRLQDAFPGVRLIVYYNMSKKCSSTSKKNRPYHELYATDDEDVQVSVLETAL